jgi:4-amino-4-deoxychorismate lyase
VTVIRVNGQPAGTLPVLDRGLQYGDGLFETIAIRKGRARLLDHHFDRLRGGCARLGIPAPATALLLAEIAAASAAATATVKLIVTRGEGPRGYRPPARAQPTCIVIGETATQPPATVALSLRLCTTRLGRNPALAGLKHLCRLEQVLARAEWDDTTIDEGLMLDDQGRLVCGTQSNLFLVLDGLLLTPRVDQCGVAGVMRRAVLDWSRAAGLDAREATLWPSDLERASEVFMTNALAGAQPADSIDGRSLPRGAIAGRFNAWLEAQ